MTRHGKNSTASAVYSYSERARDAKESGYGTLHERLGADSIKEFHCCSITLQPCRDPLISPDGYIFDREAVLEYYLKQKKENARKLKEWEKHCKKEEELVEKEKKLAEEMRLKKFEALEATPAHPGVKIDLSEFDEPTTSSGATASGSQISRKRSSTFDSETTLAKKSKEGISNMSDGKKKEFPSFWIPQLIPTAVEKAEKPEQRVLCPVSGRPLKIKELMPVKFTPFRDDADKRGDASNKVRYMCAVTHDALTNASRCAYLKTSQCVVTMSCVEKIIRKDMIDPINGQTLTDDDIIELQRGGTGFASTNKVKAKLIRPQLELQ